MTNNNSPSILDRSIAIKNAVIIYFVDLSWVSFDLIKPEEIMKYYGSDTGVVAEIAINPEGVEAIAFSKLEIIFCAFLAENNFVNLLIPFIGVRIERK